MQCEETAVFIRPILSIYVTYDRTYSANLEYNLKAPDRPKRHVDLVDKIKGCLVGGISRIERYFSGFV
jgi:hypothetical protein